MRIVLGLLFFLILTSTSIAQEKTFKTGLNAYKSSNYDKALSIWRPLAKRGDVKSQRILGVIYYRGLGVTKDFVESAKWFTMAAKSGSAHAQERIGNFYFNGIGVKQNYTKAIYWCRKAVEQKYAPAYTVLGYHYHTGRGVKRDYEKAVKWYRKAAEKGEMLAQTNLANMYSNGYGVTQDHKQALKWYKKAAAKGDTLAVFNIALAYESGFGIKKNLNKAFNLYKQAAKKGNARAQNNLGSMYFRGHGVKKDLQQAVIWFRKAAQQGNKTAATNLNRLLRAYSQRNEIAFPSYENYMKKFVVLATQGNIEGTLQKISPRLRKSNKNSIRVFLQKQVIPFYADFKSFHKVTGVTQVEDNSGYNVGWSFYTFIITKSGMVKPFAITVISENKKLVIQKISVGKCVRQRHPFCPK